MALSQILYSRSDDVVVLESLFSFITTVVFTTIGWILAMSKILQSISLDIDLSQLYTVILAMNTSGFLDCQ